MYYDICPCCTQTINRNSTKCSGCSKEFHGRCTLRINEKNFCYKCGEKEYNEDEEAVKPLNLVEKELQNERINEYLPDKYFSAIYKVNRYNWTLYYKKKNEYYIGNHEFVPLFDTPLIHRIPGVFFCDKCLVIKNDRVSFKRHTQKLHEMNSEKTNVCFPKQPGHLIYKDDKNKLTVYKILGSEERTICQNICSIGKCFLGDKVLYYDIESFEFYVLFKENRFVGYFSKQKNVTSTNLSCIVVLPFYQKKGFGFFLVDLSYKIQEKKRNTRKASF